MYAQIPAGTLEDQRQLLSPYQSSHQRTLDQQIKNRNDFGKFYDEQQQYFGQIVESPQVRQRHNREEKLAGINDYSLNDFSLESITLPDIDLNKLKKDRSRNDFNSQNISMLVNHPTILNAPLQPELRQLHSPLNSLSN